MTGAERIVVMDAGRVRAVGTHEDPVAQDQLYARPAATRLLAPATQPRGSSSRPVG